MAEVFTHFIMRSEHELNGGLGDTEFHNLP